MPLQSMTAYGFGEGTGQARGDSAGQTYSAEIRTLNSRYLEVNVRLPRHLLALEVEVINHVKTRLRRGKVDVFLDLGRAGTSKDLPVLDEEAVRHYLGLQHQISALALDAGSRLLEPITPLSLADFLQLDGVLISGQSRADPEAGGAPAGKGHRSKDAADNHRAPLLAAVDNALTAAIKTRQVEGAALGLALDELLREIEHERTAITAKLPELRLALQKTYRKRLDTALAQLQQAAGTREGTGAAFVPEERALVELAVLSDKADIDEELTRLRTHLAEFQRQLATEDAPGRKLDFLCQELHREVNTMSNKLVQTDAAQHTLAMKQIIERIRQQVQNIE